MDGEWYLIGLTTAVQKFGSTTFDRDAPDGGDANYFARISTYDQQITALVPEPSTFALLVMAGTGLATVALRRRR